MDNRGDETNNVRMVRDVQVSADQRDAQYASLPQDEMDTVGAQHSVARISTDEEPSSSVPGVRETWEPIYIRRAYLLAHAGLFTVMIVLLESVYHLSVLNQGLASVSQNHHYLWTYGPTLVPTILAAFWGQFEHRAKQLMPWVVMSGGQAPAEESILLDYTSASTLGALVQSFRETHIPVAAGILGSLLLRALIIVSTGLLSLQSQDLTGEMSLALQSQFNMTTERGSVDTGPQDLASIIWAAEHYNLTYPSGTTSQFATQVFAHPQQLRDQILYADVDVFSAELQDCEPFQWKYANPDRPYAFELGMANPDLWIDVGSNKCSVRNLFLLYSPTFDDGRPRWDSQFQSVECSNSTSGQNIFRILISLPLVTYGSSPDPLFQGSNAAYLRNLSDIICSPKYSLTRRTVTSPGQNTNTGGSLLVSQEAKHTLPFDMSLKDLNDELDFFVSSGIINPYASNISTWFSLLNETLPQRETVDFLHLSILTEASQSVFRAGAPQWINLAHTMPAKTNVSGTAVPTEDRLLVEQLSLRLVEPILTLLIVACIIASFRSPAGMVPHDPELLMSQFVMLSRSHSLQSLLVGAGALPENSLHQKLNGFDFVISKRSVIGTFGISVSPKAEDGRVSSPPAPNSKTQWWRPRAASHIFHTATILIPIILIIALETTVELSGKNRGLADVDNESVLRYAWLYGPAVIMTTVSMLFKELGSAAVILHPFQQLRKGKSKIKVMTENPADRLPFAAVIQALVHGNLSLTLTLTAVLASSVLTIVSSGLFITQPIPWTGTVVLDTTDWFNIANKSMDAGLRLEPYSGGDGSVSSLVQFYNMSSPKWTYNDLAFTQVQARNLAEKNVSVSARIPAVRARMNCSARFYQYHYMWSSTNFSKEFYHVDIDPPPGCPPMASNGTVSKLHIEPLLNLVGASFVAADAQDDHGDSKNTPISDCREGHLWYMVVNQTAGIAGELTVLSCIPFIESLLVDTTFQLPEYTIDEHKPPQHDESTATFLSNAWSAVIPRILTSSVTDGLDSFSEAVVLGSEGTPVEELVGEKNIPRLLERSEHVYRQLVAQSLHFDYRSTTDAAAHGGPFNGMVTDGNRRRLVQSAISTRILEGILPTTALCTGVSIFLEPSSRILPKTPAIIASAMSLFAGRP